jgi:hypothetical protein
VTRETSVHPRRNETPGRPFCRPLVYRLSNHCCKNCCWLQYARLRKEYRNHRYQHALLLLESSDSQVCNRIVFPSFMSPFPFDFYLLIKSSKSNCSHSLQMGESIHLIFNHFVQNVKYCHMSQWLRRGFGLVIGFIGYLQVVTTNNCNTTADLHNLQSLYINLLSLSALVLTGLSHRNYNIHTELHTPNITHK